MLKVVRLKFLSKLDVNTKLQQIIRITCKQARFFETGESKKTGIAGGIGIFGTVRNIGSKRKRKKKAEK